MDKKIIDSHIRNLQLSFDLACQKIDHNILAERFFEYFFESFPEARKFFKGTDAAYFSHRKIEIIHAFFIDVLKYQNYAEGKITEEVIRHQMYGLNDKAYYIGLIDTLMLCLQQVLAEQWTNDFQEAWSDSAMVFKAYIADAAEVYLQH